MTTPHITQLSLEALNGRDMLPLASIECPIARIGKTSGIRFERELDDLDYHDISALEFNGMGAARPMVFALRAYRGAPPDTVDILLPAEWLGDKRLRRVITHIADALDIPSYLIKWPEGAGRAGSPDRDQRRRVS